MERRQLSAGDYVIAALFSTMIVVVTAQVLWRYVFDNSLDWTEEFSRHVFVWMTFVGAALAVKEGTHIRVSILVDMLPVKMKNYLASVYLVLIVIFLGLVAFFGFQQVNLTAGQRTSGLDLPLNYVLYASLPVASLFGIWFAVRNAVSAMRNDPDEKNNRKPEDG